MKHRSVRPLYFLISLIFAGACKTENNKLMQIKAPLAKKNPVKLEKHGDVRVDDYYWMNDREDQEVLDYLNAENSYYAEMTSHTKSFQEELFQEMKSRIKEDDNSVPYKYNGYWYVTKYVKGGEYPLYFRKKGNLEGADELMFNCNELAKEHEFFNLRGISVSPDNSMASFATDTVSRRQYTIQVKNLHTGEILADHIENTTGSSVWGNDGKTLFYTKKDPVTLRSDKIYRHTLGTSAKEDVLIFHEKDSTYNTFVYKTKSRKYIVIGSVSTLTTEYQILDADNPEGDFEIFSQRERGVEYSIAHYNGNFFV
ncbi:MAG: oligopeptidase B, partial [Bacteroidota bacterium]